MDSETANTERRTRRHKSASTSASRRRLMRRRVYALLIFLGGALLGFVVRDFSDVPSGSVIATMLEGSSSPHSSFQAADPDDEVLSLQPR